MQTVSRHKKAETFRHNLVGFTFSERYIPDMIMQPRGPNFAKIHTRLGRGRLEVAFRDLIPPWVHPVCRGRRPAWDEGCAGRWPAGRERAVPRRQPPRGQLFPGRKKFSRQNIFLTRCIRKRERLVCKNWWIRLSLARLFGGFSRCYFRRKKRCMCSVAGPGHTPKGPGRKEPPHEKPDLRHRDRNHKPLREGLTRLAVSTLALMPRSQHRACTGMVETQVGGRARRPSHRFRPSLPFRQRWLRSVIASNHCR